jgi:hypothetical protein
MKAKAVPPHSTEALRDRRYSSYSFSTSALDRGEWSALLQGCALSPGKGSAVPTVRRVGGVVFSVLAIGTIGCGFEPGQVGGFLRAIKVRSTPFFGWEVKPDVPCRKILRRVTDLLKLHGDGWTKFSFPSRKLPLAAEMSRMTGPPDSADRTPASTGGCQKCLC